MFVAAVVVHGADPFQKKELAVLYLVGFTAIACLGAGKYALGKWVPKLNRFN
jgi:putative oxidoreductase